MIVSLSDKRGSPLVQAADRSKRNTRLVKALKEKATATQAVHRVFLQNQGARQLRELWAINGIAVTARASVIRKLASRPGIESIRLDSTLQAPETSYGSAAPPEWNLNVVRAPELWSLGYTGSGVVVANMDTGVDVLHPDLAAKWRGGGNSWYDPHDLLGEHATPYDSTGHGTQTMAIMVGGAAGGTAIGMAPDASWIAVKMYNDAGEATYSDIHLAFQWLLDPDGDLNTVDAPDVVNASWGLVGSAGQCVTEFSTDIDLLKTAGIAVAFAAGNDGPAPLTSLSPANNPQGFLPARSMPHWPSPASAAAAHLPATARCIRNWSRPASTSTRPISPSAGCRCMPWSPARPTPSRMQRERWRCWRGPFPVPMSLNSKRR